MKYIELTVCDEYVIITYMMNGKLQQLKIAATQLINKQ